MTDLTIDMVEDPHPAKKHDQKPSRDGCDSDRAPDPDGSPDSDRAPDPDGAPVRNMSFEDGDTATGGGMLERLLFHARSAHSGNSEDPPFEQKEREDAGELKELARCLEACPSFSFLYREDFGGWVAPSASPGRSCRVLCAPLRIGIARIEIDTGYRVRRGRIRQANLFAMMANGILRLRGFERIEHDGAVRFAYTSSCDDPARFERRLVLALACCEEAIRLFSLVSLGSSPAKAFAIYAGDYDEMDDFEFETAYGSDFDPQPRDEGDE